MKPRRKKIENDAPAAARAFAAKAGAAKVGPRKPGNQRPLIGETYTGVYQAGHRRGGFVILETGGFDDVFVPFEHGATALHGDQVRVCVLRDRSRGAVEGEINRVLRHANRRVLGQIERLRKISVVRPRNEKLRRVVEIHRQFPPDEVPDGSWVIVEISQWSSSPEEPLIGKLVEVIGGEAEKRMPILLLIREAGVVPDFPAEVEREAEKIGRRTISDKEIARRRDLRSERVFTIDPATAKDFDDAIHLVEATEDGWRLAVHIADPTFYVRPGSKIDEEAYDRATSVYPGDRVIPMLPEALSNNLCSLNPGEPKLALTATFTIGRDGRVRDEELCESVIHSVRRFHYEQIQGLIDEADGVAEQGDDSSDAKAKAHPRPRIPVALLEDIMHIRAAARALRDKRRRRGALDLDLPEPHFEFDDAGVVVGVRRRDRLEAHKLIEDLMIAANEAVGRMLTEAKLPTLYRVHEPPNEDKILSLAPALARFGINLKPDKNGHLNQRQLQAAITKARSHPAGAIVQRWVLRAMKRASYSPTNVGHYGLASECYVHFTSPIRRYPDAIVHRAIRALLGGEAQREAWRKGAAASIEQWARHTSERERRAQKIEWDAEAILTLEYMQRNHMGDVMSGFISGMNRKGFYVELTKIPAEGFVPIRNIEDDYYEYDDKRALWQGNRTGRTFAVADKVSVQIESIDVMAGRMDLNLAQSRSGSARTGRGRQSNHKTGRKKARPGQMYDWKKHVRKRRRKG